MKYFIVYLNPPRATFLQDMTPEEGAIMQSHMTHWGELLKVGKAIAFGPVMEPKVAYGVGIVAVDSEDEIQKIMSQDPAQALANPDNGLPKFEIYPFANIVHK